MRVYGIQYTKLVFIEHNVYVVATRKVVGPCFGIIKADKGINPEISSTRIFVSYVPERAQGRFFFISPQGWIEWDEGNRWDAYIYIYDE